MVWHLIGPEHEFFRFGCYRFRCWFKIFLLDRADVTDFVHQQAEGFVSCAGNQHHAALALRPIGKSQPLAHVDGGNNLAAVIHQSGHGLRSEWNGLHFVLGHDFFNVHHVNSKEQVVHKKGTKLFFVHSVTASSGMASVSTKVRPRIASRSRKSVTCFCTTAEPEECWSFQRDSSSTASSATSRI